MLRTVLLCAGFSMLGAMAAEQENAGSKRLDLFFDSSYLTPADSEEAAAPVPSNQTMYNAHFDDTPALLASAALVIDPQRNEVLLEKRADSVQPIASVTKLMTALVVLESNQPLHEVIRITSADIGYVRHTRSRFGLGQRATRADLMRLMLMASDNRAAMALANNHPGGRSAFVTQMNETARRHGLLHTHFVDPVGMSPNNVSRAYDLSILVQLAARNSLIRKFSTTPELTVATKARARKAKLARLKMSYVRNTNALTRHSDWAIDLSKTGYISKAGHCLVMQARVLDRPVVIVILDSFGRNGRLEDAERIKEWLEHRGAGALVART